MYLVILQGSVLSVQGCGLLCVQGGAEIVAGFLSAGVFAVVR
jgi:hypothetical protein